MVAAAVEHLRAEESQYCQTIVARVREGRAALFLGAGMSIDSGAPSGSELAQELVAQFAPGLDPALGLQRVADLLQSRRGLDRIDIDNWVAERLDPLQPSARHHVVPRFAWPAIFTTNYDRLIEKGYDAQSTKTQRLQVVHNASEFFEIYDSAVVSLFKLCGCISRLQDPQAPLVLSHSDLRRTRQARQHMLKRLTDLQRVNTWLFVGYSFQDNIITEVLSDLEDVIGKDLLRWSYAILPRVTDYERDHLAQYKVNAIALAAKDFFDLLNNQTNQFEVRANIADSENQGLQRLVQDPKFRILDTQFELLGYRPLGTSSPDPYYRGNAATWADLEAGLDIRREQADEIHDTVQSLLQRSDQDTAGRTAALVLTGSAGTGKSTLLRRVAYDLYVSTKVTVLVAREGTSWEVGPVIDAVKLLGRPVLVLVESGEVDFQRLRTFYRRLVDRDLPVVVLIGARTGPWTATQKRWGAFAADRHFDINESLTENEIRTLLDRLAAHGFVEINAVNDIEYWLGRARRAGRLFLVVLLELVQNGRFEEIVLSEYQGLQDGLAEAAYRTVATVHELGVPIRRELLRRMLACDWHEFIERVIRGVANKVVIEDFETVTGRAFYRTKHALIAEIVRENTVETPVSLYNHLLANIDAADQTDVQMVRSILRSDHLHVILPEHGDRRHLFQAAAQALPSDVVVRHQMGINEMDVGFLEEARKIFEACLALSPNNAAVVHSLGLLESERAKITTSGPLQELHYRNALGHFAEVIDLDRHSEYGYHATAALYLNRANAERNPARMIDHAGHALEMVELGLSEMDSREVRRLYDLKGQTLELMNQRKAAREEYAQSIERGTATAFTYVLLARLELEREELVAAISLVDQGLKAFDNDNRLLALRAEIAMRQHLSQGDLVNALGPAVRSNPKRLSLRYAYAVALYKLGQLREAEKHFKRSRDLSVGIFGRGKPRDLFRNVSGHNIVFEGRIERTSVRGGFLRIRRSDNQDLIYFAIDRALGSGLRAEDNVLFEMGFSYLGPIAINVRSQRNREVRQ